MHDEKSSVIKTIHCYCIGHDEWVGKRKGFTANLNKQTVLINEVCNKYNNKNTNTSDVNHTYILILTLSIPEQSLGQPVLVPPTVRVYRLNVVARKPYTPIAKPGNKKRAHMSNRDILKKSEAAYQCNRCRS